MGGDVCRHYLQGSCRNGDSCRYEHPEASSVQPNKEDQQHQQEQQEEEDEHNSHRHQPQQQVQPRCIDAATGRCRYVSEGRTCRNCNPSPSTHTSTPSASSTATGVGGHDDPDDAKNAAPKKVCPHWLKGTCSRKEDDCRYAHEHPPPPPPKFPPPSFGDPEKMAETWAAAEHAREEAEWAKDDTKDKWFTSDYVPRDHISADGNFFFTHHSRREGTMVGESSYHKSFSLYHLHKLAPPFMQRIAIHHSATSSDSRMHDKSERGDFNLRWDPDQPATLLFEKRHIASWTDYNSTTKKSEFKRRHDVSQVKETYDVSKAYSTVDEGGWV